MSFKSLEKILAAIENQPNWEKQRQYRILLQCWQKVVQPQVARETRPLYIARQVLWVATSSSVWAQTLSLQRYTLVKKLNPQLPEKLTDIRFSSAQWYDHNCAANSQFTNPAHPNQPHPSQVVLADNSDSVNNLAGKTPLDSARQNWLSAIQGRLRQLPLCPQCQSPTPEGELERWGQCACCVSAHWSSSSSEKLGTKDAFENAQ